MVCGWLTEQLPHMSDKVMADAADVVDGASMEEECPTTLTPPSPPLLSFNQNVAADINVVKSKTFFFVLCL
jgi:hypothetical protein